MKTRKELIAQRDPKSPISEVFRTLRTNIQFMDTSKKMKTLLLTSTFPGEGKSWVSSNLAVTFAQAGKKVILIDADMRKGRQYTIFGVSPRPGLSNYLSEIDIERPEETDISMYLQKTEVENLLLMPAGNVPPNPSELLSSTNMRNLLELLKSMYDLVLLDGTPSMIVSDSIALSTMVDSTILIAENKVSKINELKKTKRQIQDVGGKIMGVILNKSDVQHNKYYGKGYGYYYGDGKQEKTQKEIQIKQSIITVSEIIENARPVIEQELLNKEVEQELENVQVVEQQQEKTIQPKENGLGLFIIQTLIDDVKIESKDNQGTIIKMTKYLGVDI